MFVIITGFLLKYFISIGIDPIFHSFNVFDQIKDVLRNVTDFSIIFFSTHES